MSDTPDTPDVPEISKSQIKRELLALQRLGRDLVNMQGKPFLLIPLSEPTRAAIVHARQLRMGALARQLKHIGKLMRDEDVEAIREALEKQNQPHQQEVKVLHELEGWRDALLAGDDGLLEQLCVQFPGLDRQHTRQLIRNAQKEQALNKPPKSSRTLFRYLHEICLI